MKKNKLTLAILAVFAFILVTMQSCKKEEDKTLTNKSSEIIDLSCLPTYYNGKLMDDFSESSYSPTKSSDMQLTSIVDTNGVYYFDQDLLFNEFCTANQMEIIYEYSQKLNSIHQKATELGLIEGDEETFPQQMSEYWQDVFETNIQESMQPTKATLVQLFDGYHFDGTSVIGIWPCRAKLGKLDNKTSSIRFNLGLGATVMCYDKWFGGTRRWSWMFVGSVALLDNHEDDNKYSSYFCVGI